MAGDQRRPVSALEEPVRQLVDEALGPPPDLRPVARAEQGDAKRPIKLWLAHALIMLGSDVAIGGRRVGCSSVGAVSERIVSARAGRLAVRGRVGPELAVLAGLILWTLVPLFTLAGHSGVFNGGYGVDLPDLMQYMAFIRDSGEHLLISNRFDVAPAQHLLLDPAFALSGLLWRLGVSIQLALLVWVPVTVAALFVGFSAYARRMLGRDRMAVAVVLVLAFFYFAPAKPLADWLHGSPTLQFGTYVVALEMFAASYAWGTVPALSIALMPVFLLAIERILEPSRRRAGRSTRWYVAWAALAGLLVSWLHPWQGMTLLMIVVGLAAWGRLERRYLSLALPVAFTAAPLGYFLVLSRTRSAFGVAANPAGYSHFGWWLVLGVAPLILALPGFPGRNLDLQERILRIWPVAALVVYLALNQTWFYHALDGLTLPLSILAVRGWRRMRPPRAVAVAAVLAVTIPGLVWIVGQVDKTRDGNFFAPGEARALAFLDHAPQPGPVLAPRAPLGQAVPAFTGRQTYVGHYEWTPDMALRAALTEALFAGRLPRAQAIELVRASRATFLASDCSRGRVDLRPTLGPMIVAVRRFGCATVYEVGRAGFQAHIVAPSAPRAGDIVSYPARFNARRTSASASSARQ